MVCTWGLGSERGRRRIKRELQEEINGNNIKLEKRLPSKCSKEVRSFNGRIEAEDRLQRVKKKNVVKK